MRSCTTCRSCWPPGPASASSAAPGSTPTPEPRPNEVLLEQPLECGTQVGHLDQPHARGRRPGVRGNQRHAVPLPGGLGQPATGAPDAADLAGEPDLAEGNQAGG